MSTPRNAVGVKTTKLSFTFIYSIYVCSEQCSMVRAGNPVSAASHHRHASHSQGWAGATSSHGCPFPQTSLQSLCLLCVAARGISLPLWEALSSRVEMLLAPTAGAASLGHMWTGTWWGHWIWCYLLHCRNPWGAVETSALLQDLVKDWRWIISLGPEYTGFTQHHGWDNSLILVSRNKSGEKGKCYLPW